MYVQKQNANEVGEIAYRIFIDSFEDDVPYLKEECLRRGQTIKELLHRETTHEQ